MSKHGGRGDSEHREDRIVQVVVAAQAQRVMVTTTNVTTRTEAER